MISYKDMKLSTHYTLRPFTMGEHIADYIRRKKNGEGFTLVEMSIVVVIIGLLVGGFLAGKDLIKASQIRQTISQKDEFDAAATVFRNKYNCLPGDCRNASQFGLGQSMPTGGGNGNGDGAIWGGAEWANFWHHLRSAGLIDESWPSLSSSNLPNGCFFPGYHSPTPPIGKQYSLGQLNCSSTEDPLRGGWGIMDAQLGPNIYKSRTGYEFSEFPYVGRVYMILVNSQFSGSNTNIITPNEMRMIDEKIDDGHPLKGSVFSVLSEMRPNAGNGPTFSKPHVTAYDKTYPNNDSITTTNFVMKAGF